MTQEKLSQVEKFNKLIDDYEEGLYNYHDLIAYIIKYLSIDDEKSIHLIWEQLTGKQKMDVIHSFVDRDPLSVERIGDITFKGDILPCQKTLVDWLVNEGLMKKEPYHGKAIYRFYGPESSSS